MISSAGVVRSRLAGVEVGCPEGWGVAADVGIVGVELVRRGEEGVALASVRVTSEAVPAGLGLEGYAERQVGLLQEHAEALRVLDRESAVLGGAPAVRLLVAFRVGLAHLTGDQWWAVEGDRAVVVAAACASPHFPEHQPDFEAVARSVRLHPPC